MTTSPHVKIPFMPTRSSAGLGSPQRGRGSLRPPAATTSGGPGGPSTIGPLSVSRRAADRRRGSTSRSGRTAPSTSGGGRGSPVDRCAAAPARSWCTTPTPISATNVPVPSSAPQSGGTDHRPPGRQRRRPVDRWLRAQQRPAWSATSRASPSSSTHVRRAVPQHRDRSVEAGERARTDRSVAGEPAARSDARGRVRRITSPRNPSVPREPTSSRQQVEPADVLHRRPARLHDLAGGRDVARLQQHVADGPVAEAADPAAADGQRTADRAAGRQRHALAVRRQRGVELGDRRAGAAPRPSSRRPGSIRCPTGAATGRTPGPGRRASPVRRSSPDPPSPTRRRTSVRSTHPRAPPWHVGARRPGSAAPCPGWPGRGDRTRRAARPARRGRPARTSAASVSRFSSPMPCSPLSTPPASTETRTISSPAAWTRSITPGSRLSNTSSGWRLPSPAWNTFSTSRSWRAAIS